MNKQQLLSYCSDAIKFPFFGGWVAPNPNNVNPTIQITGVGIEGDLSVTLDLLPGDGIDVLYRAYYRKIQGLNSGISILPLRVVYDNQDNESATIDSYQAPGRQQNNLVPLWQISQLGRLRGWWQAVKQAAASTPPNPAAWSFIDYYDDRRYENLDLTLPAVTAVMMGLTGAGGMLPQLLSMDDVNEIIALPTLVVSDFS